MCPQDGLEFPFPGSQINRHQVGEDRATKRLEVTEHDKGYSPQNCPQISWYWSSGVLEKQLRQPASNPGVTCSSGSSVISASSILGAHSRYFDLFYVRIQKRCALDFLALQRLPRRKGHSPTQEASAVPQLGVCQVALSSGVTHGLGLGLCLFFLLIVTYKSPLLGCISSPGAV